MKILNTSEDDVTIHGYIWLEGPVTYHYELTTGTFDTMNSFICILVVASSALCYAGNVREKRGFLHGHSHDSEGYSYPAPASYIAPNLASVIPSYSAPAVDFLSPSETYAAPAVSAPALSYSVPISHTSNYAPIHSSSYVPSAAYGSLSNFGSSSPVVSFAKPAVSYGAPSVSYAAQSPSYSAAPAGYAAPAINYASPVNFASPSIRYAQNYAPVHSAPATRVVTVNKVVNVKKIVTVPQVINVEKIISVPKVIQIKKVVPVSSGCSRCKGSHGSGYAASYSNGGW
ncbi:unnamed protein product [Pieris brassicae]|uniref:Uncharacterized protein n=1 Tax=Pieris brassicae TaxID=7116 RepID=A0A9P0TKH1_PIEBR|nr:unnamed protein product [Pieris brassicae]